MVHFTTAASQNGGLNYSTNMLHNNLVSQTSLIKDKNNQQFYIFCEVSKWESSICFAAYGTQKKTHTSLKGV
jgi:hypothetical protein